MFTDQHGHRVAHSPRTLEHVQNSVKEDDRKD